MCAYLPPTGSVVSFQSDPTKLLTHASVSGAVSATINNSSVAVMSVVPHSVATLQGTNPWKVELTSGSIVTTGGNSSVQVVGVMPTQSVMLVPGIGVLGSVAALQSTNPWLINPTNSSIIVANIQQGNSSVTGTMSVLGTVPVTQATSPWVINGSVMSIPGIGVLGSVATLQGTNPWVIGNSSVQVVGTVTTATQLVSNNASVIVAGQFAEDSAHTDGQRGVFVLGVRNDTVASFTSANVDYGPIATDSQGRVLTKPHAPVEASIVATASTVFAGFGTNQAASVRVLAAPGAGLKWYITDLNLSNTGAATTLATLTDDSSNTLWKGIVPAGGGNNMPGLVTPIVSATANTPLGLVSGTASSTVHLWVAGYKAP